MARTATTPDAIEERRCRGRPQVRPDDETRRLIYEAAQHEFAGVGYAATSMETVARRAGVSTKTLYRLIPNKAALFDGMVTDRLDCLMRRRVWRKSPKLTAAPVILGVAPATPSATFTSTLTSILSAINASCRLRTDRLRRSPSLI